MLVFYVTPGVRGDDRRGLPGCRVSLRVEPGWEDRWRSFHRPARAGGLWIGPPWEHPDPGEPAVVIDPGRAFGTGAHATTRLCVELMARTRARVAARRRLRLGRPLDRCGSARFRASRVGGHRPGRGRDDDRERRRERHRAAGSWVLDGEDGRAAAAPMSQSQTSCSAPVERILVRLDANVAITSGYLEGEARRPRLAFRGPGRGGGLGCRPVRAPHDLEDGPRGISPSCRAAPRKTDWTSGSRGQVRIGIRIRAPRPRPRPRRRAPMHVADRRRGDAEEMAPGRPAEPVLMLVDPESHRPPDDTHARLLQHLQHLPRHCALEPPPGRTPPAGTCVPAWGIPRCSKTSRPSDRTTYTTTRSLGATTRS